MGSWLGLGLGLGLKSGGVAQKLPHMQKESSGAMLTEMLTLAVGSANESANESSGAMFTEILTLAAP